MKKLSNKALVTVCALGMSVTAIAGNKDRIGQSGAPELSINPWARTTGVFGLNTAMIGGLEAMKTNIAGLAQDSTTEMGVSHGVYLSGTNININNIGVAQKLGETGVIGLNVMSMGFGDIPSTDYYHPDGLGSYSPSFLNIQLGFAKQFSSHINAGAAATFVSETIGNISASGVAFDAGIQYVTGKRDNFHMGITLRNIGTNMRFSGTGFSVNADQPQATPSFAVTQTYPSDQFAMPTVLNLGVAYDLFLDENHLKNKEDMPKHRLTVMGNFTSNSFNNDYLGVGAEYGFHNMIMARLAYRYEKGIGDASTTATMYTGLAMGLTAQTRLGSGDKAPIVAIDYSYRPTQRPANGVHMMSLRFTRR